MTEERLKFAARFAELAAALGYDGRGRQTALARDYGYAQPSVKKWFDAESQPDYDVCIDMTKRARWSFEYLMTGRGPKRLDEVVPTPPLSLVYVCAEELQLLTAFREATDMGKSLINTAASKAPKSESIGLAASNN